MINTTRKNELTKDILSMYFLCSSCHWVIVDLVLRSFILPFLIVIVQNTKNKCTWVCYCKGMFFFFLLKMLGYLDCVHVFASMALTI